MKKLITRTIAFIFIGLIGAYVGHQIGEYAIESAKSEGGVILVTDIIKKNITYPIIGFLLGGFIGIVLNILAGNED